MSVPLEAHLALAEACADLRLLSPRAIAEVMLEVGMAEDSSLEVWTAPGRLSSQGLELALHHTPRADDAPTLLLGASSAAQAAKPSGERYRRLGVLGSGGMGHVEDCEDVALGRRVAVKVLRTDLPHIDFARRLLAQEARVTGQLEHPNIIPIYDYGEDRDGSPFYVMRIAEQASLADVLEKIAEQDIDAMMEHTLPKLLRSFVQVCRAVDFAHARGYAHRDLKPANILLGAYGEVLVVDWGVAAEIGRIAGVFGGTPGYIPMEQFQEDVVVDERSDVFALGAVLYEILCQRGAFSHETAADLALAAAQPEVGYRFVAPSTLDPPWPVAAELDEICRQALAPRAADRTPSAGALAAHIEDFLEGTKDKERRRRHADELVESASHLGAMYEEMLAARPREIEELASLRQRIAPWADEAAKSLLWDAEDRWKTMEALAARTLQSAIATYEQALDELPEHEGARDGLISVYTSELRRAEDRRDVYDRVHYDEHLRRIAPSEPLDALLSVRTGGKEHLVTAARFEERGRRLVAGEPRTLGWSPLESVPLPPGSYLLTFTHPGRRPVTYPVLLRPRDQVMVDTDLSHALDWSDDEVYVPGGPALVGGEDDGGDLREVEIPPFIIQALPVTFGMYLEFLMDVQRTHPALLGSYVPRGDDGEDLFELSGGRFRPTRPLWGGRVTEIGKLPVVGIDAWSAEAYAAWLSKRTGRSYRLPTELEWEKAARGVDGRRFPWGDTFDATFCKMRSSRRGIPCPEPRGVFAADVSVYGASDTAGGVADWVVVPSRDARDEGDERRLVSRGGAYCDPSQDCRLAASRHHLAVEHSLRVGFRLARTVALRTTTMRGPLSSRGNGAAER